MTAKLADTKVCPFVALTSHHALPSSSHIHALPYSARLGITYPAHSRTHQQAVAEVQALADFHKMLADNPDRAFYGVDHCCRAAALQAIQTLLITDELFR